MKRVPEVPAQSDVNVERVRETFSHCPKISMRSAATEFDMLGSILHTVLR